MARAPGTPRISVIVITRDESTDLPTCLSSVAWADEIVVVDHGSVDGTPELARRAGASVLETADWPGYGAQKQRALNMATGDWVLSLDADEQVQPGLDRELEETLPKTRHAAFTLPWHNYAWGRRVYGGQYLLERRLRLARRDSVRFSQSIVHERLIVDGSVGRLWTPVRHDTFSSPSELEDKIRRYSALAALQLHQRGSRAVPGRATAEAAWAFFHLALLRLGVIDGRLGLQLAAATARERCMRFRELKRLASIDRSLAEYDSQPEQSPPRREAGGGADGVQESNRQPGRLLEPKEELRLGFKAPHAATAQYIDIRSRHHEEHIFFRSNDVALCPAGESLAALALLPCMKHGWACRLEHPVDRTFRSGYDRIQDVWQSWEPAWRRIDLTCHVKDPPVRSKSRRVGVFFSGGVDSFYTLLRHADEITDLVFVCGFDISVRNRSLRNRVLTMVREVGARFAKRVIEIDCNLRDFLDPHIAWHSAHGAGMACIGHLLSDHLGTIYLPASQSRHDLHPLGSHPDLDRHWSSAGIEFVHDGTECTRFEKVRFLAANDAVLRALRVCWKNPGNAYNCGHCEKCLRTMVALEAVGALARCTTLPDRVDCAAISRLVVERDVLRAMHFENLAALRASGRNPELAAALETSLARRHREPLR